MTPLSESMNNLPYWMQHNSSPYNFLMMIRKTGAHHLLFTLVIFTMIWHVSCLTKYQPYYICKHYIFKTIRANFFYSRVPNNHIDTIVNSVVKIPGWYDCLVRIWLFCSDTIFRRPREPTLTLKSYLQHAGFTTNLRHGIFPYFYGFQHFWELQGSFFLIV